LPSKDEAFRMLKKALPDKKGWGLLQIV
jgi:hypothetical protein